jgi:plastocyanin
MKTKTTLLLCSLLILSSHGFAKIYTVTTPYDFSPPVTTIEAGDTVHFEISETHTVTQVSKAAYNNNDTTPLPGGFIFRLGNPGGYVQFVKVDTIYFVCNAHVKFGMKGMIVVKAKSVTSIDILELGKISLFPNPACKSINLRLTLNSSSDINIDLFDMSGRHIQNLINTFLPAGDYTQSFNLSTELPNGRYIIQLRLKDGFHSIPLLISGINK